VFYRKLAAFAAICENDGFDKLLNALDDLSKKDFLYFI
jgi:hypothetical protein